MRKLKMIITAVAGLVVSACNMTSMITYSQGEAQDFVDLSESNTPDVRPATDVSIPAL